MYHFKRCKRCGRWYAAKKGSKELRPCERCGKPIYM